MTDLHIGTRRIGPDEPVFVIAEAGSNHNADLTTAHAMIDAAAAAGADAVKFQTFEAARLYPRNAGTSNYLGTPTPIFNMLEKLELPPAWLPELRDHAHTANLAFLSTPFHLEAVAIVSNCVDAMKVASYELTHDPLLAAAGASGKPVLLSTGACTIAEIAHALAVLNAAGCSNPVIMQCTAAYPAPPAAANVSALAAIRDRFGVLSGYSDHTRDPLSAPMAAAALGAVVIEKHFTLDNSMDGPDHAYAVEPDELAAMVNAIRRIEEVCGDGIKRVDPAEEELRHFAQRSIFAVREIRRGEAFNTDNIDILRHGNNPRGLAPAELDRVLSCRAARDIERETALQASDIAAPDE